MLQELAFTGQWRHYQKRVLDKSEAFMADGHLHLVAAPGSGKTTLGIEFIRRFGQPTLSWHLQSRFASNGWTGLSKHS